MAGPAPVPGERGGTSESLHLDRDLLQEDRSTQALAAKVRQELCAMAKLGLPLALSGASGTINGLVQCVLLGRLDTKALAAVSVSGIWTSLTDVLFFSGIGQLSMFCSQAYGAGNLPLLGTWLQIYLVFVTIAGTPFMLLRWLTSPILQAFGLPRDVAELAGVYTVWSQPGFLLDVWYASVKEYYAAQQITLPAAVVDAIFVVVNILIGYLFIFSLQLGIVGAGVAFCITKLLRTIALVLFCWWRGYHKRTWQGWSCQEIFKCERWRRLLSMTVPAAVGGLAEEIQFQVCTLMAGHLGPAETAAFSLALNILLVGFLFSSAIGDSVGIRMSVGLGGGQPRDAAFVAKLGVLASFAGNVVIAAAFAAALDSIALLSSSDLAVQQQMCSLRWPFSVTLALVGCFLPAITVLTKQGRANIVSIAIPVCCWLLGFPCSYFMGQADGLVGIVDGLVIGYVLATAVILAAFVRSDWETLSRQAQERSEVAATVECPGLAAACS